MLYIFNERDVKHSPEKSGVYLLYNSIKEVIYIGKSLNIKKRLLSYIKGKSSQGIFFPEFVSYFEYIITSNEKEAFLLERDLIKSKKPKYNIKLRDDKNFFYLRIKKDEIFPYMDLQRQKRGKGSIYFGPFIPSSYAFRLLKIIGKVFKIRTCKENFGKRKKPCLDYFMGLCSAPCVNYIDNKSYMKNIENAIDLLNGKGDKIVEKIEKQMKTAADNLEYEKAAELRDTIFAIKSIKDSRYKTMKFNSNMDVWGIQTNKNSTLFFLIRFNENGEIKEKKEYFYHSRKIPFSEFLLSFFSEFYTKYTPPKLIIISDMEDISLRKSISVFLSSLKGEKVKVIKGKVNKYKEIIDNIKLNSILKLKEHMNDKALNEIKNIIKLNTLPDKIECIDISHLSGEDIVASRITFLKGEPEKSLYRRYYIKNRDKPNDPENIYNIVKRRLTKTEKDRLPDILLIDGGKAQLNYAKKAANEMNININIISISKGEKDTLHFIDGKTYKEDDSAGFLLLKRIRDEAHRFAIKYQRKRRNIRKFSVKE
jgi:excinuclease ABC subunit C